MGLLSCNPVPTKVCLLSVCQAITDRTCEIHSKAWREFSKLFPAKLFLLLTSREIFTHLLHFWWSKIALSKRGRLVQVSKHKMMTILLGWKENETSMSKNEADTNDSTFWVILTLLKWLLGTHYGSNLEKVTDLCYRWVFPCCMRLMSWENLLYLKTCVGGGWKGSLDWAYQDSNRGSRIYYYL